MLRPAARVLALALVLGPAARATEAEGASPSGHDPAEDAAAGLDAWQGPLGPAAWLRGGEPATRTHALSVGVSAGIARSPGERQRVFGLLELNIGLDDWLGGLVDATDAASDPGEPGGTQDPEDPDDPHTRELRLSASDVAREPGGAPRLGPAAPTSLAPVLPTALGPAALASEVERGPAPQSAPSPARSARSAHGDQQSELQLGRLARALVGEALRVRGSAAELRRLDGMASRSRAAASLPEVRLGAGTAQDESLRLSPTVSDPAHFSRDGGRDLWLEARLIWRLDSAIFARDEVAIMRLRAQRREDDARLASEVLDALVEWRKSCLVLDGALALPEERDAASIRQFGAVARLDVLTDGWFSRILERWGGGGAVRWP